MIEEGIFKEQLENIDDLIWEEIKRMGPKEYFGLKPDDELDPELFTCGDGSPRISLDIGDAFYYSLQGPKIKIGFGQNYFNCMPLASFQYLDISFGKQRNPKGEYDHSLGETEGFEFLRKAHMAFFRGRHGTKKTNIEMESQNMGMYIPGEWEEKNKFSKSGNEMMQGLLSQRENILNITGMRDEDHRELEEFLDLVEVKYKTGELVPMGLSY